MWLSGFGSALTRITEVSVSKQRYPQNHPREGMSFLTVLLRSQSGAGVGELGLLDEVVVAAGVTLDRAVVDVDDAVGELSNKVHVVADED